MKFTLLHGAPDWVNTLIETVKWAQIEPDFGLVGLECSSPLWANVIGTHLVKMRMHLAV